MSHSYQMLGKYFGYPDCCVDAFIKNEQVKGLEDLKGTGFCPCYSCSKDTLNTIRCIQENRISPFPFPHHPKGLTLEELKVVVNYTAIIERYKSGR